MRRLSEAEHAARFWAKVSKEGPTHLVLGTRCWVWTADLNEFGYGRLHFNHRVIGAHRRSWQMNVGPIPDGACVLHRCDNPPCVRPDHLFLGTMADNSHDMHAKGRNRQPKGEQVKISKLTDEAVERIRRLHATGLINAVELSRAFGVHNSNVYRVLSGERWGHVS